MDDTVEPRDLDTLRRRASGDLMRAGVPDAEVDADLLIGHVLGLSRGSVQARAITRTPVSADDAATVLALVERRCQREPLQHITGVAPFRGLELAVGPGVFVPRPETEQVAQHAIDALLAVAHPSPVAVDLGTGSGALALALATEVPHASIVAVENSPAAFTWARQNVRTHGQGRVRLVHDDLARALPELNGTVDVVVSNPPYIPRAAVPRDPEVRLFDPEHALYGGEDGLDAVRALVVTAHRLLRPGGTLVIEHSELQAEATAQIARAGGFTAVSSHRDLLGRDRATTAHRSGPPPQPTAAADG